MSNYKKKSDQDLLLGYLREKEAQEQYNAMSPKERREADKGQRASSREARLERARSKQRTADERTYGKDSALLKTQSSVRGDSRGGIWDVSTDNYEPPTKNKTDSNSDISEDGIDRIASFDPSTSSDGGDGSGLPDFPSDPDPEQVDIAGVLIWEEGNFDEARWSQCSANDFQAVKSDNTVGDFVFLTLSNLAP